MVVKNDRASEWARALANGGEARKPRVGDYGRSAAALLGKELMVNAHDGGYIMTGFGEGRNAAAVALDRLLTRVIGGQRQLEIIAEARHQVAQIVRARGDVLFGIEGVRYAVATRGRGPKLHQPHRPALRYRARVEGRLHHDHRPHQFRAYRGRASRPVDHRIIERGFRQPLAGTLGALLRRRGEQQTIAPIDRHVAEVGDAGGVYEAVNVRVCELAGCPREQHRNQPDDPGGGHWAPFTPCPQSVTGRATAYLVATVNHAPVPPVDRR